MNTANCLIFMLGATKMNSGAIKMLSVPLGFAACYQRDARTKPLFGATKTLSRCNQTAFRCNQNATHARVTRAYARNDSSCLSAPNLWGKHYIVA